MTVKEVRKSINEMKHLSENMGRLQDFFLGIGDTCEDKIEEIENILEEDADLNITVKCLFSDTTKILKAEIERLEKVIDNTIVNID